ncbi:MAG: S-layer homology domain-containing protein [Candidatus Latescibacterota bacterium]
MRFFIIKTKQLIQILLAFALFVSCSPRVDAPGGSKLDSAIFLYISGNYEKAASELNTLKQTLTSDSDRINAYLYLGRCYEAMGQYDHAATAYSEGMMVGGDVIFKEHIERLRLRFESDPAYAQKHGDMTRARLASLIRGMCLSGEYAPPEATQRNVNAATTARPADISNHWAKGAIEQMIDAGIMNVLADSLFHPEEKVTHASFYFIVQRLTRLPSFGARDMDELFPHGFDSILQLQLGALRGEQPRERVYISGKEAVAVLDKLTRGWAAQDE